MKSEKSEKCWSFLYRSGLIGVLVVALVVGYGVLQYQAGT